MLAQISKMIEQRGTSVDWEYSTEDTSGDAYVDYSYSYSTSAITVYYHAIDKWDRERSGIERMGDLVMYMKGDDTVPNYQDRVTIDSKTYYPYEIQPYKDKGVVQYYELRLKERTME